MRQNIYDDPIFFKGYYELRERKVNFNEFIEIPTLISMLPPLEGKRVLDLGCGFGEMCRYVRSKNSGEVTGVDISSRMLEVARERTKDPLIRYVNCAMEDFEFAVESVDLVISSLVFQYILDFEPIVKKVHGWLKPEGLFVFSVEHPMCTSLNRGWVKDEEGNKLFFPVDNYRNEGQRINKWFVEGRIIYHRMLQTYINTLVDNGFVIKRVVEPEALPEYMEKYPDLIEEHRRPPFLFISSVKR